MIKILAIGAHNDEIMGDMGATAYLLHKQGCEVTFLNLACQWNADDLSDAEKDEYRRQEYASAEALGGKFVVMGNRDDIVFLASKEIIDETARYIIDYDPDIIFIHSFRDNHIEHRETARVAYKALSVAYVRGAKFKEVYAFDAGIGQSKDYFSPHFFVNTNDGMEAVEKSLMNYKQNHANGKNLWKNYKIKVAYRGACAGLENAEAFKIVKLPNNNDNFLLKDLLGDNFKWKGNGMYPAFGEEYFD